MNKIHFFYKSKGIDSFDVNALLIQCVYDVFILGPGGGGGMGGHFDLCLLVSMMSTVVRGNKPKIKEYTDLWTVPFFK
jgi:hypothetical protein